MKYRTATYEMNLVKAIKDLLPNEPKCGWQDRDMLYLCWLLEMKIWESDKTIDMSKIFMWPSIRYQHILIKITNLSIPISAHWQERAEALCEYHEIKVEGKV